MIYMRSRQKRGVLLFVCHAARRARRTCTRARVAVHVAAVRTYEDVWCVCS